MFQLRKKTIAATTAAFAYVKLPAGAVPVPAAELQSAYTGKTAKWSDGGSVYWSGDGKVIGIYKNDAIGDGTWTVADGKVCSDIVWQGIHPKPGEKPLDMKNCWSYMRSGKTVYHQFTSDTLKSDAGWWKPPSDLEAMKSGNLIQSKYDAIKAKLPKT